MKPSVERYINLERLFSFGLVLTFAGVILTVITNNAAFGIVILAGIMLVFVSLFKHDPLE